MQNTEKHILIFDGTCNICNAWVQFILKRDRQDKFRFAALQSEIGSNLAKETGLFDQNIDSMVYLRDNKILTKSTAGLYALKELGGLWHIFFILIIVPKSIRDFFYSMLARYRYSLFGRQEKCFIPTESSRHRFL